MLTNDSLAKRDPTPNMATPFITLAR
jgi:hypothetical protein